jgi:hypothetical protein
MAVPPVAPAIDAARPAQARFLVTDEEGQPLAGARVSLMGPLLGWPPTPETPPVEHTDEAGVLRVERRRPQDADGVTWREHLLFESDGYLPTGWWVSFFPGAQKELAIRLEAERTTLIRLRGPGDEPLPRVGFAVTYVKDGVQYTDNGTPRLFFTDERGECLWRHGSLPEGFRLSRRPEGEILRDEPIVTVRYAEGETPPAVRLLQGRLLRADGSPAAGWLVARKARPAGVYGVMRGPAIHGVQVEDLAPVGPDGRFEVDAQTLLVVVSPEGIPMLYALNSRSWPPGAREVTLRAPEVRHVHRGAVVDEDGRPVVGLPIDVPTVEWNGRHWEVIAGWDAWRRAQWMRGAASTDGQVIAGITTDDHGAYAVPTYYGTTVELRVAREGWRWLGSELATADNIVWRRSTPRAVEELKQVTLLFEDEQGQSIPSISVGQYRAYSAGKALRHGGSGKDARGQHLFVDRSVDRIELEARDSERKWLPLKTTVSVADADDQVIRVTFDSSQRLLPLAGEIADPEEKPVPGARVLLYAAGEKRDELGNDFLNLQTVTDEQGKFFFDAAPDDCYVEIQRSRDHARPGLPGWTTPLAVNRQTREVAIRLRRGGTVKVMLPPGMGEEAAGMFLRRDGAPADMPVRLRNEYFSRSEDGSELRSDIIRPGRYLLATYRPEWTAALAALGAIHADVKQGEETVVDLRGMETAERLVPVGRPTSWNTVIVRHEDQVVSGAEVAVFAAVARREELAGWLQAWQSGDKSARESALVALRRAGAVAVDAIRADDDELRREDLLGQLGELGYDGLDRLADDLTDDAGSVRFEIDDGRQCVAVARVRGRLIGWLAFVADGAAVTVELQPARTLLIRPTHPNMKAERYDDETARIRPEAPMDAGMRGLMSALVHARTTRDYGGWVRREAVFDHQYLLPYPWWTEARATRVLEDLPVGSVWTVTLPEPLTEEGETRPPKSVRVTIEPGSGVQTVER